MASVIGLDSLESRHKNLKPLPSPQHPRFDSGPLCRLVRHEVIPRLLVAHSEPPSPAESGPAIIRPEDVDRLAMLAVSIQAHAVLEVVQCYLRRGIGVDTLFVELLAPAAARLGHYWDDDSIDFIDVTLGLWRLQEVLREIAARTPRIVQAAEPARTALFTPMPGEQHSFGTAMVSECFSLSGWEAELLIDSDRSALLERLADSAFDLVGLTVSCSGNIEALRPLIRAMRSVSRNPDICVMIGGGVATLDPALVRRAGADATATTAIEAVATAERRLASRPCAVAV